MIELLPLKMYSFTLINTVYHMYRLNIRLTHQFPDKRQTTTLKVAHYVRSYLVTVLFPEILKIKMNISLRSLRSGFIKKAPQYSYIQRVTAIFIPTQSKSLPSKTTTEILDPYYKMNLDFLRLFWKGKSHFIAEIHMNSNISPKIN